MQDKKKSMNYQLEKKKNLFDNAKYNNKLKP